MPTYIAVIRTIAQRLRQHRDDACTCTRPSCASSTRSRPTRRSAGTSARSCTRGELFGQLGQRARRQPLAHVPDGDRRSAQDGDGYVVDGVKHFCTMALGASYYMVWCALDGGTRHGQVAPAGARARRRAAASRPTASGTRSACARRSARRSRFSDVRVAARRGARRPGAAHARRRHRGLRARLRRDLPRHRRGGARLRDRLRQEAHRASRTTCPSRTTRPCSATSASCARTWTRALLVLADAAARWDAADVAGARRPRQPGEVPRRPRSASRSRRR